MKNNLLLGALCAGLILSGTAVAATTTTPNQATKTPTIELLYTQLAQSAKVTPDQSNPNLGTLTLYNVNKHTTWFSDRPERLAGLMNTAHFVSEWDGHHSNETSFQAVPPNATLVALKNTKGMNPVSQGSFEISSPIYNANQKSLSYRIKNIGPGKLQHTQNFSDVALFIDNKTVSSCQPWGGC